MCKNELGSRAYEGGNCWRRLPTSSEADVIGHKSIFAGILTSRPDTDRSSKFSVTARTVHNSRCRVRLINFTLRQTSDIGGVVPIHPIDVQITLVHPLGSAFPQLDLGCWAWYHSKNKLLRLRYGPFHLWTDVIVEHQVREEELELVNRKEAPRACLLAVTECY